MTASHRAARAWRSDAGASRAALGAWAGVAIGCALLGGAAAGLQVPLTVPRFTGRATLAVAFPGPGPEALAHGDLGVERDGTGPWLGGTLVDIPGASGAALWRRALTARVTPLPTSSELLESRGIHVLGTLGTRTPAAHDRALLERARTIVDDDTLRQPPGVLLALACTHAPTDVAGGAASTPSAAAVTSGLDEPDCHDVVRDAIALARRTASRGGFGLVVSVPWAGFPQVGTVWAAGPSVQPGGEVRFRMIDLAPTLLRVTGRSLPATIDGAPAYDLFRLDALFHRPVRWDGGGM